MDNLETTSSLEEQELNIKSNNIDSNIDNNNSKGLIIEELNLDTFDINNAIIHNDGDDDEIENYSDELEELKDDDFNDSDNIEYLDTDNNNTIYSYPYYTDDEYDYEYRITLIENDLILDEVKCNENNLDIDASIILVQNVFRKPTLDVFNELLKVDFNDSELNDYITLDLKNVSVEERNEQIELNKKIVLNELYKELISALQ